MHQPLPYQSPSPGDPRDIDHLRLLAILHYVWGGLMLLGGCFGFLYIGMGVMLLKNPNAMGSPPGGGPAPTFMAYFFMAIGGVVLIFGWAVGGLNLYSARSMQVRKRRMLTLVTSGINCVGFPLGTTLGVFTFIVLLRDSVGRLYQSSSHLSDQLLS